VTPRSTGDDDLDAAALDGAVAEFVAGYRRCPARIVGFPEFTPTGGIEFLFETYGLTAAGITRRAPFHADVGAPGSRSVGARLRVRVGDP